MLFNENVGWSYSVVQPKGQLVQMLTYSCVAIQPLGYGRPSRKIDDLSHDDDFL